MPGFSARAAAAGPELDCAAALVGAADAAALAGVAVLPDPLFAGEPPEGAAAPAGPVLAEAAAPDGAAAFADVALEGAAPPAVAELPEAAASAGSEAVAPDCAGLCPGTEPPGRATRPPRCHATLAGLGAADASVPVEAEP